MTDPPDRTRLAIFDLDGTLIDSLDDIALALNHALALAGLPHRSRDEVRRFIGNGVRVLVERAVGDRRDRVEAVDSAYRVHYGAHLLDHTRPYPGIVEELGAARRLLAVHTNKPADQARAILEGLGLRARFAAVVGGGDAPAKPDPAGAREILRRTGVRAEDAVYVGDSPVDVATARNAGIPLVAVTWGLAARAELVAAGAERLVSQAAELASWLR